MYIFGGMSCEIDFYFKHISHTENTPQNCAAKLSIICIYMSKFSSVKMQSNAVGLMLVSVVEAGISGGGLLVPVDH